MARIKGQNLRIAVDGETIALATNCTVNINAQLESASTKDDTGDWQVQELTGMSWDVSTDALFSATNDTGASGISIIDSLLAGASVNVALSLVGATNTILLEGEAWISSISINAPNRQNATYTAQFQGTGELRRSNG